MSLRADVTIEGAQLVTIGTVILVEVDFTEKDGSPFSISSVTADLYDDTDTIVDSVFTAMVGSVSSDGATVSLLIPAASTSLLAAGKAYALIWSLVMGDTQTRFARQSVCVRKEP